MSVEQPFDNAGSREMDRFGDFLRELALSAVSEEETSRGRWHLAQLAKDAYNATKGPQRPLDHLAAVARIRQHLDQAQDDLVAGALREGCSWGQIGRSLGISRQAARQRYAATETKADPNQPTLWEPAQTAAPAPAGAARRFRRR